MGKKFEINSLLKNNILIDKKNGLSIRNIGEKYCLNKNVVLRIIKNDNQNKEPNVEYLVCKKTNKIFYNINNKSGILSKHLKKYYSDFSLKKTRVSAAFKNIPRLLIRKLIESGCSNTYKN